MKELICQVIIATASEIYNKAHKPKRKDKIWTKFFWMCKLVKERIQTTNESVQKKIQFYLYKNKELYFKNPNKSET